MSLDNVEQKFTVKEYLVMDLREPEIYAKFHIKESINQTTMKINQD